MTTPSNGARIAVSARSLRAWATEARAAATRPTWAGCPPPARTLSRATAFVTDPGFEVGKANAAAQLDADSPVIDTLQAIESKIPQLEVRELDSIMKVKSGQVMVIGGLLEDKVINADAGVPGVSEVPYLGNLFKSVDKQTTKKELVILIRATVVGPHGYVDKADKGVYQKFMRDPRPLEF